MPRPSCCRRVTGHPIATLFTPDRMQEGSAECVVIALDELEAIRLADCAGLDQQHGAAEMQISRPTFGRVLESAHRKVAEALIHGRVLRIAGGPVCTVEGKGPRDCPRWRRAALGDRTGESKTPCGRHLPESRKSENLTKCARCASQERETT